MILELLKVNIGGFRRLQNIDLPIKPLNVLIGANGVGKTSLLDAFSLLSSSASGRLNHTLYDFGGIANILTRGKRDEISFIVDMKVPSHEPLKDEIHLAPGGTGYLISKETLLQERGSDEPFKHIFSINEDIRYFDVYEKKIVQMTGMEHNPFEATLSQVTRMFKEPRTLRHILAAANYYHELDVGIRSPIKLPQQMRPATLPGSSGEDIIPYLYYLRESDRDRFDTIVDTLHAAFPGFQELNFPPVAAGTLTMTWKDKNFNKPIYMHELSEGTLRFLWLVSLLQSPTPSTITMIDEPEVSLHPELLSLLVGLMREASQRTQLIVATHSDRFIRFLEPKEVVVMDIDDGGCATVTRADTLDIDKWLAEYSLDEVWQMGQMGGRS
ncbi:AAA family ATPase [Candidatus Magnetominusculus dajiuhuensis]|uniref:AAA family ATPase n=1 Tax=Candidatus Magnetominusculus dajiuhuensis TaxID=3137712 RepID=UPI003B43C3F1